MSRTGISRKAPQTTNRGGSFKLAMPPCFVVMTFLGGCLPTESVSLQSRYLVKRMEVMVDAADDHDRGKIPGLVKLLDNDDPATRMSRDSVARRNHGRDTWVRPLRALPPAPRGRRPLGRSSPIRQSTARFNLSHVPAER